MEAIIISSRSINQDKFFQKEAKDKYSKHKKQIELIVKEKHNIISNFQKEIESMGATLRKSKSAAKIFKVKEDESALKRQNLLLLQKIWKLEPTLPAPDQGKFQYTSGSNWNFYKKKTEQIIDQNRKICKKFQESVFQPKQYKKKLQSEIKEYLELRDSIRKCKPKGKSEKKPIKLAKINEQKEVPEEKNEMKKSKENL